MQQEDRRKCITVHGRTKKSQSILWVWRFFRFYVEKLFCVWDKPWSHTTKVVKWESKLILTKSHGLSLESVIKQAAVNQNEFKQPNEGASNIEQKTSSRNQNAKCFRSGNLHNPKLCPFINKFFFSKIRDIHQVCRKKAKSLLPIKHSSNIVSETILIENSEDDLFFIYWLLTSSVMPPITDLLQLHVTLCQ